MKRWVDFMRANTQNGLFDFKMQLGDWVALDAEPGSYFGATPTALTSQAYYALSAQLLALAAEVLGNRQDAELYAGVHRQAAQDFAANFFTLDGAMTAQTQTAHILALRFGLTPQKWKQKTIQRLLELLEQQNGHLVTGFLGTPYFCAALSQNGCWQQAYDLMLKKDYPGWLYQVLQGATTVWEHWDGRRPGRHDVVRGDELFQPLRIRRGGGMAVRRVCRYWPAAGHGGFLRRTAGPASRWRAALGPGLAPDSLWPLCPAVAS